MISSPEHSRPKSGLHPFRHAISICPDCKPRRGAPPSDFGRRLPVGISDLSRVKPAVASKATRNAEVWVSAGVKKGVLSNCRQERRPRKIGLSSSQWDLAFENLLVLFQAGQHLSALPVGYAKGDVDLDRAFPLLNQSVAPVEIAVDRNIGDGQYVLFSFHNDAQIGQGPNLQRLGRAP